mmetsp:Transcript_2768/g.2501  ORF Transcript_2768/g.2501 Transcript_2768/m.2501 type:complete len:228 (+) Transcript_2768:99-782(+)
MNLCRMGVGRIILIDKDIVEIHNLNRQLLFSMKDVGRPKVSSAKEALELGHNIRSQIEEHQIDIVEKWSDVLRIIQGATVIFNMIDYGDYFDYAAQSLAIKLGIPLIQGGTFAQSMCVEYVTGKGQPCLLCGSDNAREEIIDQIRPEIILELENLNFLPKNSNPIGQSNTYLCGACGMLMTAKYGESIINSEDVQISNRTLFYVNSMESVNFGIEPKIGCKFCKYDV